MSRCAPSSFDRRVAFWRNAFAHGLSGPGGTGSASISYTVFAEPSTSKSRRAENRCWWCGAASPGAIRFANSDVSPGASAIGDMMPVSFTSSWMLPSR